MLQALRSGLAKSLSIFAVLALLLFSGPKGHAQGTLIHYWNFNNFTSVYTYPALPAPIDADYSRIDTSKARFVYALFPGTSATYHSTVATILDFVATAPTDYDTVNLRQGALAGNGLRPRNPMDSVYLMFYIPTTNYQNILITYASQSSSTTSGDTYQYYDYSIDSGATWITTGLSKLYDSAWTVYHRSSITIANPSINNNPKLVFRIHNIGHTTLTSGNNRYDNVSVDGDSIIAPVLIDYWHFNYFTSVFTYPTQPAPIDADYSVLDTSKAKFVYSLYPGTSATYHSTVATILDFVATAPTDYDTVNLRLGQLAGNGLRPRNPMDSVYLKFYMPTTGFHDVTFTYASQSSSTTSGDKYQYFDYSTDSGLTWRTTGLSKLYDSAWTVYHRCTVTFTSDSAVNNTNKFVFRIHNIGNTTLTSGNNRYDNVTLDGIPYIANNNITTTTATFGPICNSSSTPVSVGYTSVGTYTGTYSVQLSNSTGSFSTGATTIGTGIVSPISAVIPSGTTPGNYRVRVINSAPAINGTDNGSNIIINGPPTAYAVTGGGGYCAGTTGLAVGLSNSQTGVRYQLYNGSTATGSPVSGSGSSISFGALTAAGTYTVTATNITTTACTTGMTGAAVITLNPVPAAITGITNLCAGNTVNLSDAITGGSWASNFTFVASVSSSGAVTGGSVGLATISYTLPAGCYTTTQVTINPSVSIITGTLSACAGSGSALSDGTFGGAWSSSDATLATIDASSGNVTAVSAGNPVISYTQSAGCYTSTVFTVNPLPSAIAGIMTVCSTAQTTLNDAITGGSWTSSDATLATIDPSLGTVTGIAAGNPAITYTLPTGCMTSTTITVNPLPASIGGTANVCAGLATVLTETSTGGTWSSSDVTKATVSTSGTVNGVAAGNPVITYAYPTGCINTTTVTVNPLPSATTGATAVCAGLTTPLSNTSGTGTWTSSNAHASVDVSSGLVSGISAGSSVITFTLSTGCITTTGVTVNLTPAAIAGTPAVCAGSTTSLSNTTPGGTWSSNDITIATIPTTSGLVSGVAAGNTSITYSLGSGCLSTTTLTVNPLPTAIAGTTSVCTGLTTTLSDVDGGGSWTSSNSHSTVVAGVVTGVTPGTSVITYTLPTGCLTAQPVVVNPLPSTITGNSNVCLGLTSALGTLSTGGTWSSSNTDATVDATSGVLTGNALDTAVITYTLPTGCITNKIVTVNAQPSAITGTPNVCQGLTTSLSDPDAGGSWSRSNLNVVIGSTSGLVGGVTAGTTTISYTLPTGCSVSAVVTVNPLSTISGTTVICSGLTSSLTDATIGGGWISSDPTVATIDAGSGLTTGVSNGTAIITYALSTGCMATKSISVNTSPSAISGTAAVCAGSLTSLTDAGGGVWSSNNTGVATVGSTSGTVTGVANGTATVSYLLSTGCTATVIVTVNALPTTITGGSAVCATGTINLHDAIGGGSWVSTNPSVATVDVSSGVVTSVSSGTSVISYTLTDGCSIAQTITVNTLPSAITGTEFLCIGTGTVLSDAFPGGTWTSYNPSVATIGSSSGSAIGMATGSTTITYTLPSGCHTSTTITVNALPAIYATSGGGRYCAGGVGYHVDLSGSATGVNYQLYNGGSPVGSPVAGTGSAIDFGAQTAGGTYSVVASGSTTLCISNMMGDAVITVDALPLTYNVTGGGSICAGAAGVHVGLDNTNTGIRYALYSGSTATGTILSGTGTSIDFGPQTTSGIFTVVAVNAATACSNDMTGSATVTVNPVLNPVITLSEHPGASIYTGVYDTIIATVSNAGTPVYQWMLNGGNIAGATNATYMSNHFNNNDVVTCSVTSVGTCGGYTSNKSVTIHIGNLSVQQTPSAKGNVSLAPNPNKGTFSLKGSLGTTDDQEVTVTVTNMLGQVVYTQSATATNGTIDEHIQLNNNIANGMYLLTLHSASGNTVFHMVIGQ